jgi:hypothetical protein
VIEYSPCRDRDHDNDNDNDNDNEDAPVSELEQ